MKSPHNLECFIPLELEQDERESFTTPELWAERTLLVKIHFNIFNKSSEPGPQPYAIRTMAHGMRRTKIFRVENLISPRRVSSLRPSMLCFFVKVLFLYGELKNATGAQVPDRGVGKLTFAPKAARTCSDCPQLAPWRQLKELSVEVECRRKVAASDCR